VRKRNDAGILRRAGVLIEYNGAGGMKGRTTRNREHDEKKGKPAVERCKTTPGGDEQATGVWFHSHGRFPNYGSARRQLYEPALAWVDIAWIEQTIQRFTEGGQIRISRRFAASGLEPPFRTEATGEALSIIVEDEGTSKATSA
jgi:hypothetical protein